MKPEKDEVVCDSGSSYRTPYTTDPYASAKAAVWETLYELFAASRSLPKRSAVQDNGDVWLTEKQVASLLSLSVSSLQKMRARGDGPRYSKKGRSVRYHHDDVREWMEKDVVTSTAEYLSRSST